MVFSSFEFLFRFLPVFLFLYWIVPWKLKNLTLFAGSVIFYAIGESEYVFLLLATLLFNYLLGRMMYRNCGEGRGRRQQILLLLALAGDFGSLFFFKYSGQAQHLPLGISFYTFQIAAYIIDVYRGQIPAESSFVRLGTYLTMFPQLIAGPIINYSDVRSSLYQRKVTAEQFERGLKQLILGLGAKVIIADRIGLCWNSIQVAGFKSISTPLSWIGAAAYSLELYFDFAGYSLMAMGLGLMLGFQIPRNFKYPYISKSISEFWRRWHITLGTWFREYVYIPLGGNRKGKVNTIFHLLIVWSLTALWHGSGYNYMIWGAFLLFFLTMEKLFLLRYLEKSRVWCHIYLLLIVPVTWMAFTITDIGQLGVYYTRMFPFFGEPSAVVNPLDFVNYLKDYGPLFLAAILFSTPYPAALYRVVEKKWSGNLAVLVVLCLSLYYLAISTNNPFLYFNF